MTHFSRFSRSPDEPYTPLPTEPNVFGAQRSGISLQWLYWRNDQVQTAGGGLPAAGPSLKALLGTAKSVKERLRRQLLNPTVTLAPEPPPMYLDDGTTLTLAWVMDTARRDRMSPEEAVILARALEKM